MAKGYTVTGTYDGQPAKVTITPGRVYGSPEELIKNIRHAMLTKAWTYPHPQPASAIMIDKNKPDDVLNYLRNDQNFHITEIETKGVNHGHKA